ncbi:MAG: DEAD/DEAH box helicase family protein [Patescibacteria group bacterium]
MPLPEVPDFLVQNLNPTFDLREYQKEAFGRFFHCYSNNFEGKRFPLHFLFNMATGSGKTLIMAGLILYLYERGYRNFLFFVHSDTIIKKTKDNFLNNLSSKYLFNKKISINNQEVKIRQVKNFEGISNRDINICFTTIQKLHSDLHSEKENSLTFDDFKDKKIVLIADEAHHYQVQTTQGLPGIETPNWENTVEKISKNNNDNLLLEFTATMDWTHRGIADRYINKVIYRYDLKEFRNDGFSKDVELLHTDLDRRGRIIQAIILSQYRQEVAGGYGINLKPVILFKAHRTIAESEENKKVFHEIVDNLSVSDIVDIRKKANTEIMQKAFNFFKDNKVTDAILVSKLQLGFAENKCLSVNEEKDKEKNQLLLNSLEDKDNKIRAIFAVQKLNEGWDVLNLFDIVRLYEQRGDGRENRPGRTTISEAQLIGRGARYFPFLAADEQDKFKRKYDENLDEPLRILEELHYHSHNDNKYISEIKTALIEKGMIDEREKEVELRLKGKFKDSPFYKFGVVYANKRVEKNYENVSDIDELGVRHKNIVYRILSGGGRETSLLQPGEVREGISRVRNEISLKEIDEHIIQNALAKKDFFDFSSLKKFIPKLNSIKDFINQEKYLAGFSITFELDQKYLTEITNEDKFRATLQLLDQIEKEIKDNTVEYEGTAAFYPISIKETFINKKIKIADGSERLDGQEEFLENKDWYVFNANYGTLEEKDFVKFIDAQILELGKKFKKTYLIRNERQLKIYNFKDGRAFEPDYLLFLIDKHDKAVTYQLFLEPKGAHLLEHDKWKSEFLESIKEHAKVIEFSKGKKYNILGLQFYNHESENEFKEKLMENIK